MHTQSQSPLVQIGIQPLPADDTAELNCPKERPESTASIEYSYGDVASNRAGSVSQPEQPKQPSFPCVPYVRLADRSHKTGKLAIYKIGVRWALRQPGEAMHRRFGSWQRAMTEADSIISFRKRLPVRRVSGVSR